MTYQNLRLGKCWKLFWATLSAYNSKTILVTLIFLKLSNCDKHDRCIFLESLKIFVEWFQSNLNFSKIYGGSYPTLQNTESFVRKKNLSNSSNYLSAFRKLWCPIYSEPNLFWKILTTVGQITGKYAFQAFTSFHLVPYKFTENNEAQF